jgi:hypothetical protein
VALPWYLLHFGQIMHDVRYNAYVAVMGNAPASAWESIFYYIQSLPWQLIGLPLSLIVYASFISIIVHPGRYDNAWHIATGVVLSLVLMSIATHKQGRFIMPLLPLIAVVSAVWITRLRRPVFLVVMSIVLIFSVINITAQTFDLSRILPPKSLPIGFGRRGYIVRYGTPEWKLPPVSSENWGLDDIFSQIRKVAESEKIEPGVAWCLEGNGHPYYNVYTLYSYVNAYAKKVRHHKWANFWVCHVSSGEAYADGAVEAQRRVRKIGEWNLPDGTKAQLYRCYPVFERLSLPLHIKHDDSDFYFPGFYDAESEFRWSCGKQARIELPLSGKLPSASAFRIKLRVAGLGRQHVGISVNSKQCIETEIGNIPEVISFEIESELLKPDASNIIIFDLPDARQPDKADSRILALALYSVDVVPVQ